ncbi:D-alanyl-D-alanine carboxypeptidase family protein [Patescibacteria group bacterium]
MDIRKGIVDLVKKVSSLLKNVDETTQATRKKGSEAVVKARIKLHRQRLKGTIQHPEGTKRSNWEYQFTAPEKEKFKKAFGVAIKKNATGKSIKRTVSGLSAEQLIEGLKKQPGALRRLFGRSISRHDKLDIYRDMKFGSKYKLGEPTEINLNLCGAAYRSIGLKALTARQPGITKLYVKNLEKGKGKSGYAVRGADGHFYWEDSKGYAAVYWAVLTPTKILTKAELKKKGLPIETDWDNLINTSRTGFTRSQKAETGRIPTQKREAGRVGPRKRTKAPRKKLALDDAPSKKLRLPSTGEYADKPMRRAEFLRQWREIKKVNSMAELIAMRKRLKRHPRDSMVEFPGSGGQKLRAPVALCHGMYKRYLQLLSAKTGNRYEFHIGSGHRPAAKQARWYKIGLDRRYAKLKKKHPKWSEARLLKAAHAENRKWVAPGGGSPHNTGGAQDVAITENGKRLTSNRFRFNGRWTRYDKVMCYIKPRTVYNLALLDEDKRKTKSEQMENYQFRFFTDLIKQAAEKKLSSRSIKRRIWNSKESAWLRASHVRKIARLSPELREAKLKEYLRVMKSYYIIAVDNLSQNDKLAIRNRRYLDEKLQASFFLGKTYYREGWHHNNYRDAQGRRIYANV